MNNQISFKQYRTIDLAMLSVLLIISEGLTTLASTKWFVAVAFSISTTILFLCIGMMRWGPYSAVLSLIGGATLALASSADAKRFIIYMVGNLFSLLSLLFIHFVGRERMRKSVPLLITYAAITYLFVCVGRWLVSLIFEPALGSILAYLGTDVISLLFICVLVPALRNVDGMLEDQKHYVLRQAREREEEQRKKDTQAIEDAYDDPDYLDGIAEEEYADE